MFDLEDAAVNVHGHDDPIPAKQIQHMAEVERAAAGPAAQLDDNLRPHLPQDLLVDPAVQRILEHRHAHPPHRRFGRQEQRLVMQDPRGQGDVEAR
jgi:hypothetical protein